MQFNLNVGASCFWNKSWSACPYLTVTSLEPECIKCAQFYSVSNLILLIIFKCVDKKRILDYCCQAYLLLRPSCAPLGIRKHVFFTCETEMPSCHCSVFSPWWRGHGHSQVRRQMHHTAPASRLHSELHMQADLTFSIQYAVFQVICNSSNNKNFIILHREVFILHCGKYMFNFIDS